MREPIRNELFTKGMADVISERSKQCEEFGDTHDDMATNGQLAKAGINYAVAGLDELREMTGRIVYGGMFSKSGGWWPLVWPWDAEWWKPKDRRRNLVKAAALLVAEIDRLDRAEGK